MFFILSKTLNIIIMPINWVGFLLLFGLFTKSEKKRKRNILFAVILFFFFNNHFIYNQVVRWWEEETMTADQITQPYDIGILLGGYSSPHVIPTKDRHNFGRRANRFLNAFELYKTGKVKKLLLSGGTGALLQNNPSEAVEIKAFLMRLGVEASDIIIEDRSKNTYENALFTKQILAEEYPDASLLLITSAWHMPRAKRCFWKQGLQPSIFSVDFLSERTRGALESWLFPYRLGFARWEYLIKEWVGIIMYKLNGYI